MDADGIRDLIPTVIGILVRRGADFASAEDAVQSALVRALETWPSDPPRDPKGWLITVAWRQFLDGVRSDRAREAREERIEREPGVAGLTTRQIAEAYLVPEATMAQRLSRAKRQLRDVRLDQPGDARTVLRVLFLLFNQGYSGEVDLALEAIRVTRQLSRLLDEPEVRGLLAPMLLHHARRRARTTPGGQLIPWPTRTERGGIPR